MKISERCRAYEQKFPFTPCEGDTKVETNTKGWSRHKQYSIPNSIRNESRMFWCFGVSREIRFELACRKYNKKAKILTFDPTPLSQQTVDSANRGNYKIKHTPKAYDTESGKTLNFYAIDESLKCYQLDKPEIFYNIIEVETINLKSILDTHGPNVDVIKLDIEGRWYEMLKEIQDLKLQPIIVLVECEMYIGNTDEAFAKLDSIVELYEQAGYTVRTNRQLRNNSNCVELCFIKQGHGIEL